MRYLTNENIPPTVVRQLRAAGHDVVSALECMAGRNDVDVLSRATSEDRILVTFDKDFGELAFRSHLPASSGVILLRIAQHGRDQDVQRIFELLQSRTDWAGAFWTITDKHIRRRSLPGAIP